MGRAKLRKESIINENYGSEKQFYLIAEAKSYLHTLINKNYAIYERRSFPRSKSNEKKKYSNKCS